MKALIFDIDNTLYNQMDLYREAYRHIFGQRFPWTADQLFAASRRRSDESFQWMMDGKMTMEEMYIYRIQKAFEDNGFSITAREALDFQNRYAWNQSHLTVSGPLRLLLDECVQNHVPLGIITNGTSDHQWEKVRVMELTRWIPEKHILVSADCGILKPDPAIFRLAEERMHLTPSEACFIGDSYKNDIIGAKAASWTAVWLNRASQPTLPGGPLPDYTVKDEAELYEWAKEFLK